MSATMKKIKDIVIEADRLLEASQMESALNKIYEICNDEEILARAVNTSGMIPVEYKILILPEDVAETDERIKSAKAAGLIMVDKTTDREAMAQVKGTLIAAGGNAFEDWSGRAPTVGDSVWFAKYAGYVVKGADGKEYRLANDKDIAAINEKAGAA